ncbi:6-O-methylguanine DNA methyltransferase [Lipomyces oligophaga]|uniref:6-O-methylguanine DNA methyltransferase n=1 Tax=Lipomyces oligophaga TaxID=45792 RepID=UPI0034CD08A8
MNVGGDKLRAGEFCSAWTSRNPGKAKYEHPHIYATMPTDRARPISDEAAAFYIAVYEAVQRIPPGRVTTYGHIARLIEAPQNSRQVGTALKYLRRADFPADAIDLVIGAEFNSTTVPWWRVISSNGRVAPRARNAMDRQSEILQNEHVEVKLDPSTQRARIISLREYGWFPNAESESDGENEET